MTLSRRSFVHRSAAALGGTLLWPSTYLMGQTRVRPAPSMPPHRFIETNGIRMAAYEQGDGLPVVFVHGFPELAYSWRHQMDPFAEAGCRVVAPDMRGYGLTDQPTSIESYAVPNLCGDLVGLLDALDIDRAVFCGHDWGGAVVWLMPRLYPDRVAGVIGVNTPAGSPEVQRESPAEEPLIIRTENYYATTFQEPGYAEAILQRDVRRSLEVIIRRGWYWDADGLLTFAPDSAERTMDFLRMIQSGDLHGEPVMTETEFSYYVETFEATGFAGGLNYYRNNARFMPTREVEWDISVPSLYVGAENDTILRPSGADIMPAFIADLERYIVPDCGHWTQQEKPTEFNRVALDWLRRKFL